MALVKQNLAETKTQFLSDASWTCGGSILAGLLGGGN
jgi:hypothetical protein